jgi:RNA polymerase sigma-70 factor (ECF subfamily)
MDGRRSHLKRGSEVNEMAASTSLPAKGNAAEDLADVERVLAGDAQAFEGIVRRWQGPLVNMAWRYCRDRGRAEELAQEALIKAWRGLKSWRREGSFSTWLFGLAANVYRSELKRFPTVTVPMEAIAEPSRPATQHAAVAERVSAETVRRAVLALPVRYREPVVLYYFHEMDLGAAARTMGLPEGTMKARLSRARELLRKRFPGLEEELDSHPLQRAQRMGHPGSYAELDSHPGGKDNNVARVGRPPESDFHPLQSTQWMGHPGSSGGELVQNAGKEV